MCACWGAAREDIVAVQNDQGVGDDARCRRLMAEAGRPIEEALRYARCAGWQVCAPSGDRPSRAWIGAAPVLALFCLLGLFLGQQKGAPLSDMGWYNV
jgi:hypothetical protein